MCRSLSSGDTPGPGLPPAQLSSPDRDQHGHRVIEMFRLLLLMFCLNPHTAWLESPGWKMRGARFFRSTNTIRRPLRSFTHTAKCRRWPRTWCYGVHRIVSGSYILQNVLVSCPRGPQTLSLMTKWRTLPGRRDSLSVVSCWEDWRSWWGNLMRPTEAWLWVCPRYGLIMKCYCLTFLYFTNRIGQWR